MSPHPNDPEVGSRGRGSTLCRRSIAPGVIWQMTAQDSEMKAAAAAAKAREVLAQRITKLVPGLDDDDLAQVVLRLAEAYAHLAVEPPRSRAG